MKVFAKAAMGTLVLALLVPGQAAGQNVTAHSSDGQTCRFHSIAQRDYEPAPPPYAKMRWGIRVSTCNAIVGAKGTLMATIPAQPGDQLLFVRAPAPYFRDREFHGSRAFSYQTHIDLSVRRRQGSWFDPGPACFVATRKHLNDTLICQLGDLMPAAGP
jgi:hypothetical protein